MIARYVTSVSLLAAGAVLGGCGGASGGGSQDTTPQGGSQAQAEQDRGSEVPIGADAQLEDVRLLAMDLAAAQVCERFRNRLMPIGGEGREAAEGRMWVRGCEASVEEEELVLDVDAVVYSWVDRSSSAVGAEFRVAQYVWLAADLELRVIPHLSYERDRRHAFVYLEPVRDPTVSVRTIGGVDAEAQSLWSEFVAFAAGVFGPSENERAAQRVQSQGQDRLDRRIDDGMTFAVDLCTGMTLAEMGRMSEMPEPTVAGVPGRSTNVKVHPMGLDAAGPYSSSSVEVEVTEGSPLLARLVCEEDGVRLLEAYMQGGLDNLPDVRALAEERLEEGGRATLEVQEDPGCPIMLVTNVVPEGEASSTFSYAERPEPRTLVAGCTVRQQQPAAERQREQQQGGSASEPTAAADL